MHSHWDSKEFRIRILQLVSGRRGPDDNIERENHATLVNWALTCREFAELVLDDIWHTQKSIIPLLKCLPEGVWELRPGDPSAIAENAAPVFLNRFPLKHEWSRLAVYASKIQHLTSPVYDSLAPASTLDMIGLAAACYQTHALFPKMVECHIVCGKNLRLQQIIPFLATDTLQTLHLTFKASAPANGALVSGIHGLCTSLKELNISVEDECPPLSSSCYITLEHLNHLTRLQIGPVESSILPQVGLVPKLQELEISVVGQGSPNFSPNSFPSLTFAELTVSRMRHASYILKAVSSSSLRRLDIEIDGLSSASGEEWKYLLSQLPKFSNSLERVAIAENEFRADEDPPTIGYHSLRSLCSLHELRELKLNPKGLLHINDKFLQKLSGSLPKLRYLSLNVPRYQTVYSPETSASLNGLVSLVINCPDLRLLELYLDATTEDASITTRPGNGIQNQYIDHIHIGHSPIEDPFGVAAFLWALFPNLEVIRSTDGTGVQERWKEVQKSLAVIRTMKGWGA